MLETCGKEFQILQKNMRDVYLEVQSDWGNIESAKANQSIKNKYIREQE